METKLTDSVAHRNCVNSDSKDIKELSRKLNQITDNADKWAEILLSKNNLSQNFEAAVDSLLAQKEPHVLPDYYLDEMQLSFKFLSVWLLNTINAARHSRNNSSIDTSIDSIACFCKKGLQDSNSSLLTCVQLLCPETPTKENNIQEESLDSIYGLYAFLEDFNCIESHILQDILDDEDIQTCPEIPQSHYQETMIALFQNVFKEVAIDQKELLIRQSNKMCSSLTSNPVFLYKLSKQIMESEPVYA